MMVNTDLKKKHNDTRSNHHAKLELGMV